MSKSKNGGISIESSMDIPPFTYRQRFFIALKKIADSI